MKEGDNLKKKFSLYLTDFTAKRLERIRQNYCDNKGRVTKAFIVNVAVNEYFEKNFK